MEIDVHGYKLWDAIEEIIFSLEEARSKSISEIKIIHGYKHGKVIKDYIRSEGFIKELEHQGFKLRLVQIDNPGTSSFKIL